jgi:hypothetical protein
MSLAITPPWLATTTRRRRCMTTTTPCWWSILFLSKFVILEAVDIVFGDRVERGGFFMIVILIIAMMVVRAVVELIYRRLGTTEALA